MVHDAFISYSRKDKVFARKLEQALESFFPPKGIDVPARRLEVFRDEEDFTGSEYHQSLEKHLRDSAKLVVICSPAARASEFVNDEVRRFAARKDTQDIIPVLVSGLPNNEADREHEAQKAFPEALCEVMKMPLAADYRGFDARNSKVDRAPFEGAWYALLANLYGVSRAEIEQRDRKRRLRKRRITVGASAILFMVLLSLGLLTWYRTVEARRQRSEAIAADLAVRAGEADRDPPGEGLRIKALLGAESLRNAWTQKGYAVWHSAIRQMPDVLTETPTDSVTLDMAFTPDGKKLVVLCGKREVHVYSVPDLKELRTIKPDIDSFNLAVSFDGERGVVFQRSGAVQAFDLAKESKYPVVGSDTLTNVRFDAAGNLVILSPDNVAVVSPTQGESSERRFNLPAGTTISALSQNGAFAVAVSPAGLAVFDVGKGSRLWNVSQPAEGSFKQAGFSGDGRHVIAIIPQKILLLDVSTGGMAGNVPTEFSTVPAIYSGADLYLIGKDARRISSPGTTIGLSLFEDPISAVARYPTVDPTGRYIAALAEPSPGQYALFDSSASSRQHFTIAGRQVTKRVAFDASGGYLALATYEPGLPPANLPSGIQLVTVAPDPWPSMPTTGAWGGFTYGFVISPNGLVIVWNRLDGSAISYDATGKKLQQISEKGKDSSYDAAMSASGRLLARSTVQGWRITDLNTKRETLIEQGGPLVFSPDEKRVLISSQIYELDRPDSPAQVPNAKFFNRATSRPGSNFVIAEQVESGVQRGKVLFDWRSGRISDLPNATNYTVSPDDSRYAAFEEGKIVVAQIGKPDSKVFTQPINPQLVTDDRGVLTFSPDGKLLAILLPGLIRVYNPISLQLIFEVDVAGDSGFAGFTKDSRHLVTYIRHAGFPRPTLHPITLDDVLAETCSKVLHSLTTDEWRRSRTQAEFHETCAK